MRWYMTAWLGVGSAAPAVLPFCTAAPRRIGENKGGQLEPGQLSPEGSTSIQPTGILQVPVQLPSYKSDGTMNSTFHYHPSGRQELAVTTGSHSPIHKVVGVHALQIHAEEDSRSTVDSASSKISYSQDHSTTGSTHVKTRWKFSDTSFLQEIPVPSTAILVVVGTCIILVLTVVGIVTYYALFNRTKVRRQSARERLKCYGEYSKHSSSKALDGQAPLSGPHALLTTDVFAQMGNKRQ
ncbi:hypothetical protein cyc_08623 [Cyclospora cayetanensis]|uniref:Transmembrane protein n=1 Tax=Cyclospora cayetanensis TaxID=88456 RepID=A0A1D3DA70_9EIME|nr:hypothetical protein cyc_08623 [Cyclospora cayetanensis]